MVETRRTVRLWGVVTTLALIALLVPAVAFGSLMTGQSSVGAQASNGFVADRVYAIIGNDYAMTVSETASTRTVDIIDANYKKTVELVDSVNAGDGWYSFTPMTAYGYDALFAHGVKVEAKSTGLYGVVGFDGKVLIPVQYETLSESGAYVLAVAISSQGVGTISILSGSTGKTIASAGIGKADSYVYAYWSSDSEISYDCYGKDGSSSSGVYRFSGSKLVKGDSAPDELEDTAISEGIIEHEELGIEGPIVSYLDKNGDVIESLVGWSYWARTANGYLFHSEDWSKAKIVDANARVLVELPDAALDGKDASFSRVIGSPQHIVFKTSDGKSVFYSASGVYEKAITLLSGQNLTWCPAGYLFVGQTLDGRDAFGNTMRMTRVLDIYDSSLNKVSSTKPALGRVQGTVNGTVLYGSGLDASGLFYDTYSRHEPNMLMANGEAFKAGSYTLVRPVRGEYYNISVSDISHSAKNAYVAKSSSGKYGLATTAGKAVVPFSYDDIFVGASNASGIAKSDCVMVKKGGAWQFYDVKAGALKTAKTSSLEIVADKTVTVSGGVYKVLSKSARTAAYQKPAKSGATVKIPATVKIGGKSYKVTSVAANAFKNDKKLKNLTVGANVATVGKSAFQGCKKLTKLTFKTKKLTAKKVGAKAFKGTPATLKVKCGSKAKAYAKWLYKKGVSKKAKVGK